MTDGSSLLAVAIKDNQVQNGTQDNSQNIGYIDNSWNIFLQFASYSDLQERFSSFQQGLPDRKRKATETLEGIDFLIKRFMRHRPRPDEPFRPPVRSNSFFSLPQEHPLPPLGEEVFANLEHFGEDWIECHASYKEEVASREENIISRLSQDVQKQLGTWAHVDSSVALSITQSNEDDPEPVDPTNITVEMVNYMAAESSLCLHHFCNQQQTKKGCDLGLVVGDLLYQLLKHRGHIFNQNARRTLCQDLRCRQDRQPLSLAELLEVFRKCIGWAGKRSLAIFVDGIDAPFRECTRNETQKDFKDFVLGLRSLVFPENRSRVTVKLMVTSKDPDAMKVFREIFGLSGAG